MSIGKIYDTSETTRLDAFITQKATNLDLASNDSTAKETKVISYAVLLVGAIVTLLSLKLLIGKKK